jgi:hypothetical protein
LILSCSSPKKNDNKIFIISVLAKSDKSHFTVSPKEFYRNNNFIIDSSGQIFYYGFPSLEWPASMFTKLPIFIDLKPERIVQVPNDNIVDFLKCNLQYDTKNRTTISISSQKDTINSKSFTTLFEYLSDSTKDLYYWIRRTTIEENLVLYYKIRLLRYERDCIDWDSTKTYFNKWKIKDTESSTYKKG